MQRYFLKIAYNGTNYHGWQVQPNAISVQEELEKAISTLLRVDRVATTGCGRTDAGVHAREFYLHFDLEVAPPENFVFRLNRFLPSGITVYELIKVEPEQHTRFDASSRTYEYHIHQYKDSFKDNLSAFIAGDLDVDAMNKAAAILLDYHDFASFCKANGNNKTTICDVRVAEWSTNGTALCFTITADRFLRNMVRAVVGTLLEVGQGKMKPEGMHDVLKDKDRGSAGVSVPACGLYLTKITYPYIKA